MAYDDVQICNLALSRIGQSSPISSLDELTTAAEQCKLLYAPARDALLTEFEWPFANRSIALGLVTDHSDDSPAADYLYDYRVPADCLLPRSVQSGAGRNDSTPIPFTLSSDTTGLLLLTDQASAVLRYTVAYTDPTFFSPNFASCLAWRLAVDLSMTLAVTSAFRDRAIAMDGLTASKAAAEAMNGQVMDPQRDAESIQARNG